MRCAFRVNLPNYCTDWNFSLEHIRDPFVSVVDRFLLSRHKHKRSVWVICIGRSCAWNRTPEGASRTLQIPHQFGSKELLVMACPLRVIMRFTPPCRRNISRFNLFPFNVTCIMDILALKPCVVSLFQWRTGFAKPGSRRAS